MQIKEEDIPKSPKKKKKKKTPRKKKKKKVEEIIPPVPNPIDERFQRIPALLNDAKFSTGCLTTNDLET